MKSHLSNFSPPGGRVPPQEVVAMLREENPEVELVYAGSGKWILGTVRHDRENQVKTSQLIGAYLTLLTHTAPGGAAHVDAQVRPQDMTAERRRELHYRLWKHMLQYQGFRTVTVFDEALMDSSIVDAYKQARWSRRNPEAAAAIEAAAFEPIDGTSDQEKRLQEVHASEARSIHRYAFRHQKSVLFDIPDYDQRIGRDTTTARSA